jgi:hypothetical protein
MGPARLLRHPENAGGAVFVRVFRVSALRLLLFEFGTLGLERVRDVLEEDQAENHMLVLRRVHVVAQRVGGRPELCFNAGIIVIRHYHYLPFLIEIFGREYSAGIPAMRLSCGWKVYNRDQPT